MRPTQLFSIDSEFNLLLFNNTTDNTHTFNHNVSLGSIQFHFNLKGTSSFLFNQGNYSIDFKEDTSFLLYNPKKELPINLLTHQESTILSLIISLEKLHQLFSDSYHIPFLNPSNIKHKYYHQDQIKPSMTIVLNQILNAQSMANSKELYLKAKSYELLCLYFNKNEDPNSEHCPFLLDQENILKIKKAKDIILKNFDNPPTLEQLSEQIDLSLKKLKLGFKEIYGNSIYGFLLDYKLEYGRKLLNTGTYNVNEVGEILGYSTSSHFISAFKKKFGITPKKYTLNLK